jgi:hypothetical protein
MTGQAAKNKPGKHYKCLHSNQTKTTATAPQTYSHHINKSRRIIMPNKGQEQQLGVQHQSHYRTTIWHQIQKLLDL